MDVRFIAVNDNFDTLTAERTQDGYIVPLKNIMNAVYSKDISRKILPAISTKQQKGEFIVHGRHTATRSVPVMPTGLSRTRRLRRWCVRYSPCV